MRDRSAIFISILFFAIILTTGLLVFKDYGIPWDEPDQILITRLNQRYIFLHDPTLLTYRDRYYGMVFELPILWLNTHFSVPRHLLLFLVFFIGLVVVYGLTSRLFRSRWWGLLASVMLAASPRIFANSFYNSKDIPFLVVASLAVWTLVLLSDHIRLNSGWRSTSLLIVLHSITSAAFIGTRIPGVMIVPLTLFAFAIDFMVAPNARAKIIVATGSYLVLSAGLTVLIFPVLWNAPWHQFLAAFRYMSRLSSDVPMLFMGSTIQSARLPWQYLPVWIGITTPLIVVFAFFPGLIGWISRMLGEWKHRVKAAAVAQRFPSPNLVNWTVVVLWIVLPVAAVYVFHSVLYDSWRHLFFIYPPILLISLLGLRTVYQWVCRLFSNRIVAGALLGGLLVIGLAEPVWFMARYHPFEYVYFNALAGNPATLGNRFDMDYWGLSYKQGIDYILAHDPRPSIKIAANDPPAYFYIEDGLPAAQKARIIEVLDLANADYFVTDFRFHPEAYPYPDEYYSVRVRGATIMAVYKIH